MQFFFFWSGQCGDDWIHLCVPKDHEKALSLRQELGVWPHHDSPWLTEIPSSLQTRGQAAGQTVHRRRKEPENFPLSVSLASAQTCSPAHHVVPGKEHGLPFCWAVQDGESRGESHPHPHLEDQETREQATKPWCNGHRAVGRHQLPAQPSRAVMSCGCLSGCGLSQPGGFNARRAAGVSSSRAGYTLSPARKRFMSKAVMNNSYSQSPGKLLV